MLHHWRVYRPRHFDILLYIMQEILYIIFAVGSLALMSSNSSAEEGRLGNGMHFLLSSLIPAENDAGERNLKSYRKRRRWARALPSVCVRPQTQ
jgi:hypothetical protein